MISVDIDLIGVAAFLVDVEPGTGVLRYGGVNDIHERNSGIRTEDVVGRTPRECFPIGWAMAVEERYRSCIRERKLLEYDEELDMPTGRRWWRTTLRPALDPQTGEVVRILGIAVEITERKHLETKLGDAVYLDHLTGVSNRRRLELDVGDAMDESVYSSHAFSLVVVDIDAFKSINDEFGHRVGDEVLRYVAGLLRTAFRTTDTVARIGGDEFAVKVSASTEVELASVVASLRSFVTLGLAGSGLECRVGLSIGAALWQPGQSFEDLLAVAVADMYREKARRRAA